MLDRFIEFENSVVGGVSLFFIFVMCTFIVPYVFAEIRNHVKFPIVFFIAHPIFVYAFGVSLAFTKDGNGWTEALLGGAAIAFIILFINMAVAGHVIKDSV